MTNQGESMNYTDDSMNCRGDYNKPFDPRKYLDVYDKDTTTDKPGQLRKFMLDSLHKFFKNADVHGDRLLDIGTGPSITSVISAMNKFRHIYLSDVSRPSLDALWEWQRGDAEAHDFSPFFKHVINLEQSSDNLEERQNRLRGQIQRILYGDMYKDRPFEPCCFPAFDGIVSCLSLLGTNNECVVRRACHLLKPGGWMISVNVLQKTFYKVQDEIFHDDYVTVNDVVTCWEKCGLEIVDVITSLETGEPPEGRLYSAMLARKAETLRYSQ